MVRQRLAEHNTALEAYQKGGDGGGGDQRHPRRGVLPGPARTGESGIRR